MTILKIDGPGWSEANLGGNRIFSMAKTKEEKQLMYMAALLVPCPLDTCQAKTNVPCKGIEVRKSGPENTHFVRYWALKNNTS